MGKKWGKNGIPGIVATLLKLAWNLNLQKERKLVGVDDSKVQTKDKRSVRVKLSQESQHETETWRSIKWH